MITQERDAHRPRKRVEWLCCVGKHRCLFDTRLLDGCFSNTTQGSYKRSRGRKKKKRTRRILTPDCACRAELSPVSSSLSILLVWHVGKQDRDKEDKRTGAPKPTVGLAAVCPTPSLYCTAAQGSSLSLQPLPESPGPREGLQPAPKLFQN